jgi:hypothetical protein
MIYVWAAIAGLIFTMGGIIAYERHGKVEAIASLTAYKQSVAVTTAKAIQERDDKIAAQEKANALIVSNLQATLGESAARGIDLARRLRIATATVSGHPVQGAGIQPDPVAASGVPQGAPGVDESLARYDAACQRDSARLDALIAEVKGQMGAVAN